MFRSHILGLVAALPALCQGATFGENEPGSDVFLSAGSIAVQPDREVSFVVRTTMESGQETGRHLVAIPPDSGEAEQVADLSGRSDIRISFPRDRVLVMSERSGVDQLRLFDSELTELGRKTVNARYHGTRTSPSGQYIAVADNIPDSAPIHLINTETLDTHVVPHNGSWLEANWLRESDRLLAIVFYSGNQGEEVERPYAKILSWSMPDLEELDFVPGADGLWPEPEVEAVIMGASYDFFFSFSWIAVDPTDTYAVIPLAYRDDIDPANPIYRLAVLSLETGSVRLVDDAQGPVGFTPDGSTVVSYRYVRPADGGASVPHLLMVDPVTLDTELVDMPLAGLPTYFVSHDANLVVVGDFFGSSRLLLYDIDNDRTSELDGPTLDLHEFVSRLGTGQLWLLDNRELYRIDLWDALVEHIPLAWTPEHINILRLRDQLVFDSAYEAEVVFYDPELLEIIRTVSLEP